MAVSKVYSEQVYVECTDTVCTWWAVIGKTKGGLGSRGVWGHFGEGLVNCIVFLLKVTSLLCV